VIAGGHEQLGANEVQDRELGFVQHRTEATRLTVTAAGLELDIRREGVAGVIREMIAPRDMEAAE